MDRKRRDRSSSFGCDAHQLFGLDPSPSSVRNPHVGNSKRPVTRSYSLSCNGRESSTDKADQRLDIESIGQYQCFGTAMWPGLIEHVEHAALVCAKRRQGPDRRL